MGADRTQALAAAAEAAGHAPSIHNTQPWRWRVNGDRLELLADRTRQLSELDPDSHLLLLSCGAALHHARVALAAEGWGVEVERPAADPLAVLRLTGRTGTDPVAMRRFQAALVRRTDRRPTADQPVDPAALAAIGRAVEAEHEQLHVLRREQVVELAAAVGGAMRAETSDAGQREELARWVGGARGEGTGVPDAAIPSAAPQTTVPGRDFGVSGDLSVDAGHDTHAVYAVLYGTADLAPDWLRAGEALSAAWLDAVDHGLNLLPISSPVEIARTRYLLRLMLAEIGYPHLVVRIGAADPDHAGPPHPPRLAADQVIEVIED
jgi:hypothetical protein